MNMDDGRSPANAAEQVFYQMVREQGVWADGCGIFTCGPTTGHFVRPIAFCASPEIARLLASAMSAGTAETNGDSAQGRSPASAVGSEADETSKDSPHD